MIQCQHQQIVRFMRISISLYLLHFYNESADLNYQLLFKMLQNILPLRLILLLLLTTFSTEHIVKEITNEEKQSVTTYVNQESSITIPFSKCFKVEAQLEANKKYISFEPTRVSLTAQKSYSLKNQGSKISVLEELRSPISYKHRHMLIFDGFLMVLFAPNVVLVVEEISEGFVVKNRYYLQNLDRFDQFKMYKIGNKGLIVVYNKRRAYLLSQLDYEDFTLPDLSTIIHLTPYGSQEFFAAQFMKGLTHYRINFRDKTLDIVKKYTGNDVDLPASFRYIVDLSLSFYQQGLILVLDAQVGLIQFNTTTRKAKIVVSHIMCQSFDTIERTHIVLLCQNQGHSTIIEVYRYLDKKTKQYAYRKVQPILQANYLTDLHVADSYFLVYSYKSIHVFWNTQKNRLPQTLQTQSQLILPGLQTFSFVRQKGQNYLYTIEAGQLFKYNLTEKAATLSVKSDELISKTFKLFLYGSCADLSAQDKQQRIQACKVGKTIQMRTIVQEYPREQDFGISASIVGILITVFLLVIWICLKKYKGLEREARKVLENYQNKRMRQNRKI